MSSPLALAAVTAVLKDLLNNGLIDKGAVAAVGTSVAVSAKPPDRVFASTAEEDNQLNLFLYQVTPNSGWNNVGFPSRDGRGDRLSNPPLALDLHYLLTAYGKDDLHAEILLGYAMQLLHETPILTRGAIRKALEPPNSPVDGSVIPVALSTLAAADLASQVEQIKVTPSAMGAEEISKLWTALQAHYRPTAAYQVSVVLIESTKPARSPLPVLYRGDYDPATKRDAGVVAQASLIPPYPTLEEVNPPNNQPSVYLGETLTVRGHHLAVDAISARLTHTRTTEHQDLAVANDSESGFQVTIPNAPDDWRAGFYSLGAVVEKDGKTWVTQELPWVLAPKITALTNDGTANGVTTLKVTCTPKVWKGQVAVLVVRDYEIVAETVLVDKTEELVFKAPASDLPTGNQWVRLYVDGVSSRLVDQSGPQPELIATERRAI